MTFVLLRKLLRDIRGAFLVVFLLLGAFECLWAKIAQRISEELVPGLLQSMDRATMIKIFFQGPGKLMETLMGGESVRIDNPLDVLTVGYVHPLVQFILAIWAVGRAAGAISGEIDRGTMELLLAQPVPRNRLVFAHLLVDLLTIPLLCLAMWAGNWIGVALFGKIVLGVSDVSMKLKVDPRVLAPGLLNTAALLFAISGYTIWLSARGRFRSRVLGIAVFATLIQFLVNVIGQLWDTVAFLRPFTVFYYYQPQQIILRHSWTIDLGQAWNNGQSLFAVNVVVVLLIVGIVGYGLALWSFCRRDLPAPL